MIRQPVPPTEGVDAYCSSGPSPTPLHLHLLGVGAVGRALLTLLGPRERLVGASDSSGTALDPWGLSPRVLHERKGAGTQVIAIAEFPDTWPGDTEPSAGADVVIDATPTRLDRGRTDAARIRSWLSRGQSVVLASKHALAADPELLAHPRIGANGVLGGTGARLQASLSTLRLHWTDVALAGNASTTTIITCIEQGGSFADGLAEAAARGVLEPDPELDLRGHDAAVKLALVAGALQGTPYDVAEVAVQDLRSVSESDIRSTAQAGRTTRLVGRADRSGTLSLRYEALDLDDPLAVAGDAVAYRYALGDTEVVHVGHGVGALGTARAVLEDVDAARTST